MKNVQSTSLTSPEGIIVSLLIWPVECTVHTGLIKTAEGKDTELDGYQLEQEWALSNREAIAKGL